MKNLIMLLAKVKSARVCILAARTQESHVFYFKIYSQISYSPTVGHDQCSILKTQRHTCFHLILTKIYSRFQMIICHQYTVLWDRKHHLANLIY